MKKMMLVVLFVFGMSMIVSNVYGQNRNNNNRKSNSYVSVGGGVSVNVGGTSVSFGGAVDNKGNASGGVTVSHQSRNGGFVASVGGSTSSNCNGNYRGGYREGSVVYGHNGQQRLVLDQSSNYNYDNGNYSRRNTYEGSVYTDNSGKQTLVLKGR